MTKKHQAELTKVAERIYDLAANEIQVYINKAYGDKQENTLAQQSLFELEPQENETLASFRIKRFMVY